MIQNPDKDVKILSPPVILAGREIYLVVHVHAWAGEQGGIILVKPCALLIKEGDSWFFVPVDEC